MEEQGERKVVREICVHIWLRIAGKSTSPAAGGMGSDGHDHGRIAKQNQGAIYNKLDHDY